jgi:hypothetical protein
MTYLKPGMYRRAFDWRLSRTNRESIPNVGDTFATLSSDDYAEIFEDYLRISRLRKNNRTALAKLQLHLFDELIVSQHAIKQYRTKLNELRKVVESPQASGEHAEEDIKVVERELFFHRAHANCVRSIGDGIAWRALGYDRAALRALSGNAVKQQLLDEGIVNELHEWSRSFDTGKGIAILNALTNSLAIGDITVIKNDGSVEIVEVKSSQTDSNRVNRQKQRMREVTELLRTGRGTLEGTNVTIVRFDVGLKNDLQTLFRLLYEASLEGWAGELVSNCLYIETFDSRRIKEFEKVKQQALEKRAKATESWMNDDLVIDINSMDFLAFTPNCAPFSVFPFPERLCIDLLTAAQTYVSFLNLTEVGREFERLGWEVEKWPQDLISENEKEMTALFRLHRDGMHPAVPPADITRMEMETLRPEVAARTLDAIFDLGPEGMPTDSFTVYNAEKSLWL